MNGDPPGLNGGATAWSYPDPKWLAGVTTVDKQGVPDHFARVVTYTTGPFDDLGAFLYHALR